VPGIQGIGNSYASPAWMSLAQWSTSTTSSGGAFISLNKSNGVEGTQTIVANGQRVGGIGFAGSDGAKFLGVADIYGEVDAPPALNSMPGRLVFATTADGFTTPSERMRITRQGRVGIWTTNPSTALDVNGTVTATSFSGPLTGAVTGNASTASTWATPRTLTIGSTDKSVNGSANISWSHNEIATTRDLGAGEIKPNATDTCTTTEFVTAVRTLGAFLQRTAVYRCTWNYAGNADISDTGFGALELAGCIIETFTDAPQANNTTLPTTYHIRVTSPNSGTGAGGIHEYNNHGAAYNPGWRRVYTSSLNGNITGNVTGSSGSCTGNAATVTTPSFAGDSVGKDNIITRTQSGFYETNSGTIAEGWPINDNAWQHLIACTHSNDANYYSMQIGGSFGDQDFYGRKTNGSGTTTWSRFITNRWDGEQTANIERLLVSGNGLGGSLGGGTTLNYESFSLERNQIIDIDLLTYLGKEFYPGSLNYTSSVSIVIGVCRNVYNPTTFAESADKGAYSINAVIDTALNAQGYYGYTDRKSVV
jgi:hypothetical protein